MKKVFSIALAALMFCSLANAQTAKETINERKQYSKLACKNLIMQRIGRTVTVVECYRNLPNDGVEVRLTLAYNSKMAIEESKEIIKKQLEEKGEDLHEQLDAIWNQATL